MSRCPMKSSVTGEQCRGPEGHPCYDPDRFHRFTGCIEKSWCVKGEECDGDHRSRDDLEHEAAFPGGCGNRECFTCVQILGVTLPEGFAPLFPHEQ